MTDPGSGDEDVKKGVVKATVDTSVYRIAQFMQKFNVGCVIITRDDEPIGMVTDRDLALAIGTSGFDPKDLTAAEIMNSPVETVEAGSSLHELLEAMEKSSVRRLPVVENGKLVDIVTMDDLIGHIYQSLGHLNKIIEAERPAHIYDLPE